jgi:hypothetical protein
VIGLQTLLQTWTKGFGRLESVAFANNPRQDVKRFFTRAKVGAIKLFAPFGGA